MLRLYTTLFFFDQYKINQRIDYSLSKSAIKNWSTIRMANRPVSKTKLLPSKDFEYEQSYLIKVPQFVSAPYINCNSVTDQYGYASFEGNYYWIPGTKRNEVKILRYCKHIKISELLTL